MTTKKFRIELVKIGFNHYIEGNKLVVFRPEMGLLANVGINNRTVTYPGDQIPPRVLIQLISDYVRTPITNREAV